MAVRLEIDRASLTDNDIAGQVEFTAELKGDDRDFAVTYSALKELSGDERDSDALEVLERFSDEIIDVSVDAAVQRPLATVIVVDEGDLE